MSEEKIDTALYVLGWCVVCLLMGYLLISKITGFRIQDYLYPCLFHAMTGYYCPGCGGTRAVLALLRGAFLESFIEHPIVLYTAVPGSWFLLSQTIERISRHKIPIGMHYHDWYLWIGIVVIVLNFAVKNLAQLFWGIELL